MIGDPSICPWRESKLCAMNAYPGRQKPSAVTLINHLTCQLLHLCPFPTVFSKLFCIFCVFTKEEMGKSVNTHLCKLGDNLGCRSSETPFILSLMHCPGARSPIRLDWLVSELQESACLHCPSTAIICVRHHRQLS